MRALCQHALLSRPTVAGALSLVAFSPVHRAGEAAASLYPRSQPQCTVSLVTLVGQLSPDFLNAAGSSQCLQHGVVRTGHDAVA